jgi:signal transduction histidine kinase
MGRWRACARLALRLAFLCFVAGTLPVAAAQEAPRPTVLTIHWGPEDFPASPVVSAAIREALTEYPARPVDYFAEYFESDSFPEPEATAAFAEYIRHKYRNRRIDVVIAIADPVLRFVLAHRDLFPDAPIVYTGPAVPEMEIARTSGPGLTGVTRGTAYLQTLELALELHPATEDVLVVAGRPDRSVMDVVHQTVREFSGRVRLTFLTEPVTADLLASVKAAPSRSLVLYVFHSEGESASRRSDVDTARLVAEASPVPVYGTNESYVGAGVVGAGGRGIRETATRMGEMARRILDGATARSIPIEEARLIPTFDWRQLRRWDISESSLPAGSVVRFRTPGAWELYRGYIVGGLALVVVQLLLIVGLLRQWARRRKAEQVVRAREATLRSSHERRRKLVGALINAEEATRANIARDLHDDVCQDLVGISIGLSSVRRMQGRVEDTGIQQTLKTLQDSSLEMVEGVRRLSHDLHPASLKLLGLAAALRAHCVDVERRHDVQVFFDVTGDATELEPGVAVSLFRIAQEALRNGAVHGQARRLGVTLETSAEHVHLVVTDDGRGFEPDASRTGLGLVTMEERARLAGGTLEIVSQRGGGTIVRVRVPAPGRRVPASAELSAATADMPSALQEPVAHV